MLVETAVKVTKDLRKLLDLLKVKNQENTKLSKKHGEMKADERPSEAVAQRCSAKQVFLEISQN